MTVYDDQRTKADNDELRRITGINPEQEEAMDREAKAGAEADKAEKERSLYNPDGDKDDGKQKDKKTDEDDDKDDAPGPKDGLFGQNVVRKLQINLKGKSKTKKRMMIAGAAAGGSLIGGVLIFLALLPLKVEHMVDNLQTHFSAAADKALGDESQVLLDKYMVRKVMPHLGKGACHSTIDAACISDDSDANTPIGKLFHAWHESRLELTLAEKYNLQIGKKNGEFYVNTSGKTFNLKDGNSIFDSADTRQVSRNQLRREIYKSFADSSKFAQIYGRFRYGPLLEHKYGLKRCVIACNRKDKFTDSLINKQLAAKGYIIERVVGPMSDAYGIILECIIGGGSVCDNTKPTDNTDIDGQNDQEKISPFQANLQKEMDEYIAKFADEATGKRALAKVLDDANEISDKGFTRYFVAKIAEKLGVKVGTDKALDSAVPILGWVNFISNAVVKINTLGPKLKVLNYAIASTGAVQMYMSYRTVADEAKSGHMDVTELGSFANTLSDDTQLDGGGCDMTKTPLYNDLMGGSSSSSLAFGGSASAAGTDPTCKCNNGDPVPTGKEICDEEHLNGGSKLANAVTDTANAIPGWNIFSQVANLWYSTVGQAFRALGSLASGIAGFLLGHIPGLSQLGGIITGLIQPFIKAITDFLIPSPFSTNMSGGRSFALVAAGADVAANKTCQVQLGCAVASPQAINNIRNQQLADAKYDFDNQSIFARMFSTDSQYSLISKIAMSMPTSTLTGTSTGIASFVSNPLSKIGALFSSVFSTRNAFALSNNGGDIFGVTQVAYPGVPADPEAFWDKNCVTGPLATYDATSGKIDVSAWLDTQQENPDTGESDAHTTNACLLIDTAVHTAGPMFDPTLLPQTGSAQGVVTPGASDISAYKNPYRAIKHIFASRIDGGVDYSGDDGPIYPIGNAKIISVDVAPQSGWPGIPGSYILYQLLDGPAKDKFVYFAEDCTPLGTASPGKTVSVDQPICNFHYASAATEIGWSCGHNCYLTDDYNSHGGGSYASNTGQNMSALLVKLGNPPGDVQGPLSNVPMPAGFPTW